MAVLGEDIKKLGFGLMRLPTKGKDIDIEQVCGMVDLFLAAGFTYFDTAWAYGGSEEAICKALVERYPRDRYTLATKNAAWINCKTAQDARDQFTVSLERSGAGYFDFYLLHNLGESRTHYFDDFDMWNFVLDKKKEGLIKHIGFSFHSNAEELDEILTKHPEAEFVQLQVNYADWDDPVIQSRACFETAHRHGKPVVIMEPVKGGMLATPPEPVARILKAAEPASSCASWAIRFAAGLPGIVTVLSGMSSLAQMQDNLSYMKDFTGLTPEQKLTLDRAREALSSIHVIPCTDCRYCQKVCPAGIAIPETFAGVNQYLLFGDKEGALHNISWQTGAHDKKPASDCRKCGLCEKACPQHIDIRAELDKARHTFGI